MNRTLRQRLACAAQPTMTSLPMRAPGRTGLAAAILAALPMLATAQEAAPPGAEVRYTPITGSAVPLYPSAGSPAPTPEAPSLFATPGTAGAPHAARRRCNWAPARAPRWR